MYRPIRDFDTVSATGSRACCYPLRRFEISRGANQSFGPFGDILATNCLNQGIIGAAIDSTIRNVADIKEMKFRVFRLGAHPAATAKQHAGNVDVPVTCGGARVRPGDIIVGDDDGVVVIPFEIADVVADRVQAVVDREREIKQKFADGMAICEIFEIFV